jgi:LysM repeat protein
VLGVTLGLLVMLSGPIASAIGLGSHGAVPVSSRTYVVRPGDSLWSIATAVAPARDPRLVVDEIRQVNGSGSTRLVPGQVLSVPAGP